MCRINPEVVGLLLLTPGNNSRLILANFLNS